MSTTTAAKERPKDFRGLSVRAILEGHKTQFREVVKLPDLQSWQLTSGVKDWHFIECSHSVENCNDFIAGFSDRRGTIEIIKCPYGKPADPGFDRPADRLWVRETWATTHGFDTWSPREIPKEARIYYSATAGVGGLRCRPSIFMPRWASRITLEITAVRVERLQSIGDADALAEGCTADDMRHGDCLAGVYARLWQSINGPGSWDANPWVWVVEFRRVQP